MAKDLTQELLSAVEEAHKVKAAFKSKVHTKETTKDGTVWEGDVYVFHLLYATRHPAITKPDQNWELSKPSAQDLNAAEMLGKKMKQDFQQARTQPEKLRKAKLAYAWVGKVGGKTKTFSSLHQGPVNSAEAAVKLAEG
jgi:hypothetical protein